MPIDIPWYLGILVFIGLVLVMEVVAIYGHKYVMHGFGWGLHRSHHTARHGFFEANDWYGVMGAAVAISFIFYGVEGGGGSLFTWIGAGIVVVAGILMILRDRALDRSMA